MKLRSIICIVAVFWAFEGGCSTDPTIDENYAMLSMQKHRTELPTENAIEDVSVDSVAHWSGARAMPFPGLRRERWSDEDRGYVFMQEWRPVRMIGYLLEASNQGDGDIHLSIGDSANSDLSTSVIVEMIPYYRQLRNWQLYNVQKYLRQPVRVTGWLLWDEEHHKGPDRASVWEIHPITKFEVFDGSNWQPL